MDVRWGRWRRGVRAGLASLILVCCSACHTPPFPSVDLASPLWQARSGQAIWRPGRAQPEIVGDLLVATGQNGNAWLQFSKAFPIVTAQLNQEGWQVEFPPRNRHYAAPGHPPRRIGWLQWLRAWKGEGIPAPWQVIERTEGAMTLENARTGERLEAHF